MRRDPGDDALAAMLRRLPPGPAASFTDEVMLRVSREPRRTSAGGVSWAAPALDEPGPSWWTRPRLQPVTIGAFVVAAILAGWPAELVRAGAAASTGLAVRVVTQAAALPVWASVLAAVTIASLLLAAAVVRAAQAALPPAAESGPRTAARR